MCTLLLWFAWEFLCFIYVQHVLNDNNNKWTKETNKKYKNSNKNLCLTMCVLETETQSSKGMAIKVKNRFLFILIYFWFLFIFVYIHCYCAWNRYFYYCLNISSFVSHTCHSLYKPSFSQICIPLVHKTKPISREKEMFKWNTICLHCAVFVIMGLIKLIYL